MRVVVYQHSKLPSDPVVAFGSVALRGWDISDDDIIRYNPEEQAFADIIDALKPSVSATRRSKPTRSTGTQLLSVVLNNDKPAPDDSASLPVLQLAVRLRKLIPSPSTDLYSVGKGGLTVQSAMQLRVFVLRARRLKAVQKHGQDPFVKLEVLLPRPDEAGVSGSASLEAKGPLQTHVAVDQGTSAVWNSCFDITVPAGSAQPTLSFEVLDHGRLRNKPIGGVRVQLAELLGATLGANGKGSDNAGRCARWLNLAGQSGSASEFNGELRVAVEVCR